MPTKLDHLVLDTQCTNYGFQIGVKLFAFTLFVSLFFPDALIKLDLLLMITGLFVLKLRPRW